MYFNEFLNILYREELLSYDVEQHEAFIKSNRDYIESLKTRGGDINQGLLLLYI